MKRVLVCALLCMPGALAPFATAATPDWARPYLKTPLPRGAYIAKGDEWVAVYSDVEIGASAAGGLSRRYRLILAPNGDKARRLVLALDYDEVTETLVEPKVWVPGRIVSYKELKIEKRAVDAPDLDSDMVTSGRGLVITTEEIGADQRAIVSWEVDDRLGFPGEARIFPFSSYPAAEFHVRAAPATAGAPPHLTMVDPQADGTHRLRAGGVDLTGLPALRRLYPHGDPLVAAAMETLPYVVARAGPGDEASWKDLAGKSAALFQSALQEEDREATRARALALTQGAASAFERVARLAGFVQSLTYRNVAWGQGAYRPESPKETLRTMSADCKGKTLLLLALLREVEVASTPVICYAGDRYLDTLPVPTLGAFNHVVLAIHLPERADSPAALTEGPGKGFLVFDPTNPLSTLLQPPINLEGTRALWAAADGDLFTVHTREPGGEATSLRLEVGLRSADEATLDLTAEGSGDLLDALTTGRIYGEDREKFRSRCQEALQVASPGLLVSEARFDPPDHLAGRAARLEVKGTIRSPLQPVGAATYALASPVALLGLGLGMPLHGYKKGPEPGEADSVSTPPAWTTERCCRGVSARMRGEIHLALPEGWSVKGVPSREITAPWIRLRTQSGPSWAVTIEWPRGRFPAGSGERMLQDFNSAASLFRQSLVVAAPGG